MASVREVFSHANKSFGQLIRVRFCDKSDKWWEGVFKMAIITWSNLWTVPYTWYFNIALIDNRKSHLSIACIYFLESLHVCSIHVNSMNTMHTGIYLLCCWCVLLQCYIYSQLTFHDIFYLLWMFLILNASLLLRNFYVELFA